MTSIRERLRSAIPTTLADASIETMFGRRRRETTASFRHLHSADGRVLCISAQRSLVACRDGALPKVVLFSTDGKVGGLVAEDLAPFTIQEVGYRSPSVAVDIFTDGDVVELFLRSEHRFLSIGGDGDPAHCWKGGPSRREGASFHGTPAGEVLQALNDHATDFETARTGAFVSKNLTRATFLAALASSAPVASEASSRRLSELLRGRPHLLQGLIDHDPSDYWATTVLGPLIAPDRHPDGKIVGTELDWLGDDYVPAAGYIRPKSFGERLVYAYRGSMHGRDEICIVATARNEGLYLVDWIAYHRAIGIERIHIYANENDDGSDALLDALDRAGHIRFVRSHVGENRNAQGKAYGHAFRVNRSVIESTWCLVCDLDEYFVFDRGRFGDARDYVAWATSGYTDVLTFRWGFVGPSRQVRWSSDAVIDRFVAPPAWADMYAKSMFRTGVAAQSYPHFPIGSSDRALTYRNALGDIRTSVRGESEHRIWGRQMDDDPTASMAYLAHYYYKSAEEFVVKHTRNRGDHPKKARVDELVMPPHHLSQFVKLFDTVEGRWPIATPASCAPGVGRVAEMIRSDREIAAAEAHVRSLYRQRRDVLVASVVDSEAFEDLGDDARAFKRLLTGAS